MPAKETFRCPFCLSVERDFELKFDRRSRPYLTCASCNTIAFIRRDKALRGLRVLCNLDPLLLIEAEKKGVSGVLDKV